MANEEQIGFHKGSLATLVKEQEELSRLLQIVNSLIQAHIKALKNLGIDLEKEAKSKKGLDQKVA
ncbi:MAG: hypothetical protein QT11_C0001G0881 [archaeon GW2011_AR20]|nr:MAG: hypothetical protein QT11_C0001G0881 [archaeon GW2011_AR20]MBS3160246.1 hypothetical protein [Candidatus Woesearchaeota archaeon]